jgi:hypothetical protein
MELRGAVRTSLITAVAALVVGCSSPVPSATPAPAADTRVSPMGGQTVPRSDPADQFIVAGRTVDASGGPQGGLEVFVIAEPDQKTMSSQQVGDTLPETGVTWTPSDADGRFAIHLRMTDDLMGIIRSNGGFVNLSLYAFSPEEPSGGRVMHGMWGFPLRWSGAAFSEVPEGSVTLKDLGAAPEPGDPTPPAGG